MGGIGNFLHNKPWHPSTYANQKAVWVAEQKAAEEERLTKERAEELQREREDEAFGALQGAAETRDGSMDFMYRAPPGLKEKDEAGEAREASMDAAALAFEARRRAKEDARKRSRDGAFSAAGHTTALERETGGRNRAGPSRAEQVERFPELAGAPVEGNYADSVKLTFQPFGKQLRNVRCTRCGEWGHEARDRECPMNGFDPHETARAAAAAPPPAAAPRAPLNGDVDPAERRRNATSADVAAAAQDAKQRLVLKASVARSYAADGAPPAHGVDNAGYELVDDADDYPAPETAEDREARLLASLSPREKKALLKRLTARGGDDGPDRKKRKKEKKKKHKKKHKKKKHKSASDSSSDSDAS